MILSDVTEKSFAISVLEWACQLSAQCREKIVRKTNTHTNFQIIFILLMTLLYEAASCKFQIYNQQILSREYIRDIGQIFRFFEE